MSTTGRFSNRARRRLLALPLLIACCACGVRILPPRPDVPRRQIVILAQSLVGLPYVYGGSDIDGFDCSGLVFYVYDCFGIRLPRSAREQGRLPGAVKLRHALPGDILVFKLGRSWHSAIFLGEGRFVHAPNSEGWVRYETLNEYWRSRLEKVVAILPGKG
jgi:cell wall-associated NlpC family hydrolase